MGNLWGNLAEVIRYFIKATACSSPGKKTDEMIHVKEVACKLPEMSTSNLTAQKWGPFQYLKVKAPNSPSP